MAMQVKYEWTMEIIEDDEIVDSDFSDSLSFDKSRLEGNDLGLVRNEGNENEGVTDRLWAYVKDGKLPQFFSNANGLPTGYKVPVRFHNELANYIK